MGRQLETLDVYYATATPEKLKKKVNNIVEFISRLSASSDSLHGDGLFPVLRTINGKVVVGTGLQVKIQDYLGMVDGYKLFLGASRVLNSNEYQTLTITKTGEFYVGIKPIVDTVIELDDDDAEELSAENQLKTKWGGLPRHAKGIPVEINTSEVTITNGIPFCEGKIVVAKLNVPVGTTQITDAMIDNSFKKWLADIDKSIMGLSKYVDEAVERAKREIYAFILGEYTVTIRNEIAQGDAAVRAELDAQVLNLEGKITDLGDSMGNIRQSLEDFQAYVNEKIEGLGEKTAELQTAVNDLGNAVAENTTFILQLQENISKVEGDIVGMQVELQDHLERIETLETGNGISAGIFELNNSINISKNTFLIENYHNASMQNMYKHWADAFSDGNDIDPTSIDWVVAGSKLKPGGQALPTGIVGLWRFDEGQGNVTRDDTANHNDGLLVNDPLWIAGKYNSALSFDGINDYVSIPHNSSLSLDGNFTIAAWIYPVKVDNFYFIVTKLLGGGGTNNNYELRWVGTTLQLCGKGGAGPQSPSGTIVKNVWQHVIGIYDGTYGKVYVNGVLKAGPTLMTTSTNTKPVSIGTRDDRYTYLPGYLDEVVIFNRVLNVSEINDLYLHGIGVPVTYPVTVTTKAHDFGIVPVNALLAADDSGDVTYQISRNNGTTWTAITKNTLFTFTTEPSGQLVRVRMTLPAATSWVDNMAVHIKEA